MNETHTFTAGMLYRASSNGRAILAGAIPQLVSDKMADEIWVCQITLIPLKRFKTKEITELSVDGVLTSHLDRSRFEEVT